MTNIENPYPKQPGFDVRVMRAETAIKQLAHDPHADIYTRSFDNCFEMYDGDAVVFALMHKAYAEPDRIGRSDLTNGIRQMFKSSLNCNGFPTLWEDIALDKTQLSLLD